MDYSYNDCFIEEGGRFHPPNKFVTTHLDTKNNGVKSDPTKNKSPLIYFLTYFYTPEF